MNQVDRQSSNEEDTLAWVIEGNRVSLGDLTGITLGDFRVDRLLARGGMGEVYLATQISLDRVVALKVLRPDYLAKGAYLSRFRAEATAIARLNHPNIVHVYAIGNIDQVHYIAMEYVEGTNLRDYIRKKGPLDLPVALTIMKQTAQAIGAAGEEGLIHRDVKPENILITKKGRVKVADFGLCRFEGEDAMNLTQSGITMGTPLYMSPEQAQGHPLDHRSDLYSLGVTYYFILAGEPPFRADTAVALALKHVREIPRSLVSHRPDIPLEIDRLVMKLMAKDPADRYQSAAMMLADLAKIREVVQGGTTERLPENLDGPLTRTEELPEATSHHALAVQEPRLAPAGAANANAPPSRPARVKPATLPASEAGLADVPTAPDRGRFSVLVALAALASGLFAGAVWGWTSRAPDVMTLPREKEHSLPGLWLDPRWRNIPRRNSAEEQLRYALLEAPRDEWDSAWLAVPGYHPRSHESSTKAYTQLARTWYRSNNLDALEVLQSELGTWKDTQTRDQDLANVIQLAIKLKKGDIDGVAKEFDKRSQAGVADMHDPALVALSLELCTDALQNVQRSGTQTEAETLRRSIRALLRQLNRIEVVGAAAAGAGQASPAGRAADRSKP
jgi:serine/threonine-protein kinase